MVKTFEVSYLAKKFVISINVEGMSKKDVNQKLFDEAKKQYFKQYR